MNLEQALVDNTEISDEQRALVTRIGEEGSVSYEDYAAAAWAAMDCVRGLGFVVDGPIFGTDRGQTTIAWGQIFRSEDQDEREIEQQLGLGCYRSEMAVVDMLYQTQPTAIEWERTYLESFRAALTECLEGYGIDTGPGSGAIEDLLVLSADLASTGDWSGPSCTDEIGMFAPST